MPAMITVTDLTKTYLVKERTGLFKSRVREINALKNIDLEIKEGELFGLMGLAKPL
jgi:ABC-type oligopeptide transport system ATPase subunit